MRLLGSTKEDVDADKNSENEPKLQSFNLVKNDYQHTLKVLFSFVPNKEFGQLINMNIVI